MKHFVIGDIHGRIEALKQVLNLSKFDYNNDKLILLGDIVDGGYNTYEVVEELIKIKNKVFCLGNHDKWYISFLKNGYKEDIWTSQGGDNTLISYNNGTRMLKSHHDFFNSFVYYYIDDNNRLFVHGGYNPDIPFKDNTVEFLLWDRSIIDYARELRTNNEIYGRQNKLLPFEEVFIGHTHVSNTPINILNLWLLDTGAGWNGKLCIMNIDTKDYWLSDIQKPAI